MKLRRLVLFVGLVMVLAVAFWSVQQGRRPQESTPGIIAAQDTEHDALPLEPAAVSERVKREQAEPAMAELVTGSALSMPSHRVLGRVVDQHRQPVGSARVKLALMSKSSVEGTSGEDGRFELLVHWSEGERPTQLCLFAEDTEHRGAALVTSLPPARAAETQDVDAGTLVLAPAFALEVQVVSGGSPAPGAIVKLQLGHGRFSAGEYVTNSRGMLELKALPPGPLHLSAKWEDQAGYVRAFVPQEQHVQVVLEPVPVIDVLVVDAKTGEAIPSAELSLHESYAVPQALPNTPSARSISGQSHTMRTWSGHVPPTNEQGHTYIEGLSAGVRYEVEASAEGYEAPSRENAGSARIEPGARLVRLELTPQLGRRVQWPVVAGELPVPADGTTIGLRYRAGTWRSRQVQAPPPVGQMVSGKLTIDDLAGSINMTAVTPDGALAHVWCDEAMQLGPEVSFRRSRRITVVLHNPEGSPLEGKYVRAYNQGNNPLGEAVETDEEGRATLGDLFGGLADVRVSNSPKPYARSRVVGSVDLEQGDGHLDVILDDERHVSARLTLLIDGRTQLPARFLVTGPAPVKVVEELPDRGELLLELTQTEAEAPITIWLNAVGFAPQTIEFTPNDGSDELGATIELVRTSLLIAEVKPPAKDYFSIKTQRFDEQQAAWRNAHELGLYSGLSYPNGPGSSFIFQGLTPGRWRVVDERSKLTSSEATLLAGDAEVRVELDLSVIEWAAGRVELDDPDQLRNVRVLVGSGEAEPRVQWRPGRDAPEGTYLQGDSFRIRVPNDRDVELYAWHPWLVPDATQGRVTLHGGRDGIVLKLVEGDGLILPQTQLASRGLRVARYAAGTQPEGEALGWHHAVLADGALRCSLPRGRWTLLIDPGSQFQPLVLPDVEIEGPTELPPAQFTTGSTLRLRLLLPEGSSAPRLYLKATRQQAPVYDRSINSPGEEEVLLTGLGPGRYDLKALQMMGGVPTIKPNWQVEVDGINDLELELDLR